MATITSTDGTEIFYKDWGSGPPIMFHHGWPLSSDDWDNQMLFFLGQGFRVIAHDRRGHGRSAQVSDGHDMDHYADDARAVVEALDLQGVVHIGHSTGGGEVVRYLGRHGTARASKAVLIGAIPPIMLKTDAYPLGLTIDAFDGYRTALAANRAGLYRDVPIPFYSWNRDGAVIDEGIRGNWWRQGMIGSAKAHYDGIKAFSETDFTDDLKAIDIPVLQLHGEDDQIVPIDASARTAAKLLKHGTLKTFPGLPHGMATTHADVVNAEILTFIKS